MQASGDIVLLLDIVDVEAQSDGFQISFASSQYFFQFSLNVEYMHNFLKSRPLEQEGGWRGVVGQMGW